MFLTITIDTTQAKKSKLRMNKVQALASKGWRERFFTNKKKLSFWQKFVAFRRKVGGGIYKLGDQTVMF